MPSSNHKLKVGIIGYGVVGKKRHSILKKYKQLKVIAASDVNDHSLLGLSKNVQTFNDYKKLINESNCSVVFISVPNRFAAEATKLALRKGMHVFCEKPPARSSQELGSIKNLIQGKKIKLKYGFNHRYHASILKASEIINSGRLGKIVAMRGIYGKSKIISFDQSD